MPKSFMILMVEQFIKSDLCKFVSEECKLKERCIKENYQFRTRELPLFLSLEAIYMKNFYTKDAR